MLSSIKIYIRSFQPPNIYKLLNIFHWRHVVMYFLRYWKLNKCKQNEKHLNWNFYLQEFLFYTWKIFYYLHSIRLFHVIFWLTSLKYIQQCKVLNAYFPLLNNSIFFLFIFSFTIYKFFFQILKSSISSKLIATTCYGNFHLVFLLYENFLINSTFHFKRQ